MVGALANALEQAPRRRWRAGAVLGVVLIAAGLVVPSSAWAQLVTFSANTPAIATQVNGNFQQLRTWLEQKVGPVGTDNITTSGTIVSAGAITAPSLSVGTAAVSGNSTIGGTLTTTGQIIANGGITGSNVVVNGVNIRPKALNNGTTNCDSYCNGSFLGFTGSCLGAKLPSGLFTADCAYAPGLLPAGQQLLCLCATY